MGTESPGIIGAYQIRGVVGRGGVGTAYDAWDPVGARRVALRVLRRPDAAHPGGRATVARFLRAAEAARHLAHPAIVAVLDSGEADGFAYVAMEVVEGPTLQTLFDKQQRFTPERVASIMGEVLAGLQHGHERGVVHGDLKPDSIVLNADGHPKIADFGLLFVATGAAGAPPGLPDYLAPEQFLGAPADARSNIYAAGVLLYQLLTGAPPFAGAAIPIIDQVLNTDPPAPSDLPAGAPRTFDAVVQKAMAKRSQDRFASAAEFALALRTAVAVAAGEARKPPPAPEPAAPPPTLPSKSRRPLLATAAAVALVALTGAGWWLGRSAAPPEQVQPVATAEVRPASPSVAPVVVTPAAPAVTVVEAAPQPPAAPPAPAVEPGTPGPQALPRPPVPEVESPVTGEPPAAPTDPRSAPAPMPAASAPATAQVAPAPPAPPAEPLPTPAAEPPAESAAQAAAEPPALPQPAPAQAPAAATPAPATALAAAGPLPAAPPPAPTLQQPASLPTATALSPTVAEAASAPPPTAPAAEAPSGSALQAAIGVPPPALPEPPAHADPDTVAPPVAAQSPTAAEALPAPAAPAQVEMATDAVAPALPPPPPAPPPAPAATARLASVMPPAMLRRIAGAVHAAKCALADAAVGDGGAAAVHGLADAATAAALRRQVGDVAAPQPIGWYLQTVDPVFCPVLALLRPISVLAGAPGPGVGLTLAANRTVLADGEAILPRVTMPDFAGTLRVDYFAHDGTLAHLYPTLAEPASQLAPQPARRLAAGETLALGDPGPGKPQWESGAPYGTDLIMAVASSVPLKVAVPHNTEQKADAYVAALGRAIEQARAAGARVSGAVLLVDTEPKLR